MSVTKLNKKLKLFVEGYDGENLVDSMRMAGYTGIDSYLRVKGNKLLKERLVVKAIEQRDLYRQSTIKIIATREERQAFWTSLMRNSDPESLPEYDANGTPKVKENIPLASRIRASELLGKSEVDFIERVDLNAQVTITDIIADSYLIEEDLDTIEAEYERVNALKKLRGKNDNDISGDMESDDVAFTELSEEVDETPPSLSSFI